MADKRAAEARRQKIREKKREVKDLRKEEFQANWGEYKTRIYLSFERLLLMVVSLTIFGLHCANPAKEDSLVDRGITPMAFGGDFLVQLGLFIACAAFLYVHPVLLLVIDAVTGALIVIEFCVFWPTAFYGLVLAIYLITLLDIILHTIMLAKEVMTIRAHLKHVSRLPPQDRTSEPEGWGWVMGPRYSSATWSRKSTARSEDDSRKGWRPSDASRSSESPPPKKSLLTRAQERMRQEEENDAQRGSSHKSVVWNKEHRKSSKQTNKQTSIAPASKAKRSSSRAPSRSSR